MGCDIHMHIEVLTENGWELYSRPHVSRNYDFFAKLADVRNYNNEIIPLSDPKGLPEDVSYLVRKAYEHWEGDVHSISYITGQEIIDLCEWLQEMKPFGMGNDLEHHIFHTYLEGDSFAGFYKYPDDRPSWIKDIRFVFWFDN